MTEDSSKIQNPNWKFAGLEPVITSLLASVIVYWLENRNFDKDLENKETIISSKVERSQMMEFPKMCSQYLWMRKNGRSVVVDFFFFN